VRRSAYNTAAGATVTLPKTPDGRFISALVVDNDHYAPAVFYEPGTHEALKALTEQYERDAAQYSSWKGMMGPRGAVDEKTRHIAAAAAWGLNPEKDATYLNYRGPSDDKVCYKATYKVPENNAFWSITVYGADGFMKSENCILNSSSVKKEEVLSDRPVSGPLTLAMCAPIGA